MVFQKTIPLLIALMGIAALAAPPASAATLTSAGVSCFADTDSIDNPLFMAHCIVATVETVYDCQPPPYEQYCVGAAVLRFTLPEWTCAVGKLNYYESPYCAEGEPKEVAMEFGLSPPNAWDYTEVDVTFCADATTSQVPQCAHWTHVVGPGPNDPDSPLTGIDYTWYLPQYLRADVMDEGHTPFVGAGAALA